MPATPHMPSPITLDVLLSLHDEAFVTSAYSAILGRAADADGFAHYLAQVRTGTSRAEIVADLARSMEGRRNRTQLPGLRKITRKHGGLVPSLLAWLSRRGMSTRAQSIQRQLRVLDNNLYLVQQAVAAQTDLITELLALQRLSRMESAASGQPARAQGSGENSEIARTFHKLKAILAGQPRN